jgi:hypothetical protein
MTTFYHPIYYSMKSILVSGEQPNNKCRHNDKQLELVIHVSMTTKIRLIKGQKDTVFRQEVIILQDSSSENQPLLVHRNPSYIHYLLL